MSGPSRKKSSELRGQIESLRRKKYPQRVLGACSNFNDIAVVASRVESLIEVRLELPLGGAGLSCIATRVA